MIVRVHVYRIQQNVCRNLQEFCVLPDDESLYIVILKKLLVLYKYFTYLLFSSGVAGPLAARDGGQICRPFVLGFGNCFAFIARKLTI